MLRVRVVAAALFLISFALILFELLLTRLFGVVLFAQFAHLALALALLGIGVGSVAQHLWPSLMPEEGLERRLGWLALLQAVLTVVAVLAVLYFPVVEQFETPPETYQERSAIKDDLLNTGWFIALLPMLALPFTAAGLAFAGVFQRMRQHIGPLYGADLVGGAFGAVLFLPLLGVMAGPDTLFPIVAALGLAGLGCFWLARDKPGMGVSAVALVLGLGASAAGVSEAEVLRVRSAAGYAEQSVEYTEWTPLVRLAIHRGGTRPDLMLLDNASASEIPRDEAHIRRLAMQANRSLVYRLEEPGGRVAILAASAGPEVAVAQLLGHRDIDAIDVAGDIMEIVAERYADVEVNPYTQEGTRAVSSDGRAAILHAEEPYQIIHMVHANLWSSAGLLSNAWSPSLLETVEAFHTYLDMLEDDGTLSFARGSQTGPLVRSAAKALRERGVEHPYEHIALVKGHATVLLVKKRAWTEQERARLISALAGYDKAELHHDPFVAPETPLWRGRAMTDDRPYLDDPSMVGRHLKQVFQRASGASEEPLTALYRSVVIQVTFVMLGGLFFVFLPMLRRGPTELGEVRGVGKVLLYVSCLGYGYLAVETILIHELVLFVGHPTYAVTVVILAMLLFSGIGSVLAGRMAQDRLLRNLRVVLVTVLVLGSLQAFVFPELLHSFALGLPRGLRVLLTGCLIAPLGLVMGMPFPLAMRLIPRQGGGIVPWAWALNGWMSVVAGLATVLLSRIWGYSFAFGVALFAYALAFGLSSALPRLTRR